MTAQISKSEQDERGLLPYPVIIAATKGDPEAMNIVVQHYESYIASLSMRSISRLFPSWKGALKNVKEKT